MLHSIVSTVVQLIYYVDYPVAMDTALLVRGIVVGNCQLLIQGTEGVGVSHRILGVNYLPSVHVLWQGLAVVEQSLDLASVGQRVGDKMD